MSSSTVNENTKPASSTEHHGNIIKSQSFNSSKFHKERLIEILSNIDEQIPYSDNEESGDSDKSSSDEDAIFSKQSTNVPPEAMEVKKLAATNLKELANNVARLALQATSKPRVSLPVQATKKNQPYRPFIPCFLIHKKTAPKSCYETLESIGEGGYGCVDLVRTTAGNDFYKDSKKFGRPPVGTLLSHDAYKCTSQSSVNTNMFSVRGMYALKSMLVDRIPDVKVYKDIFACSEIEFIFNVPYHPNLLRVYEVFTYSKQVKAKTITSLHITTELMMFNMSDILEKYKRKGLQVPPKEIRSILRQVLSGLSHVHRQGYVHRDIKPDNILLTPTKYYHSSSASSSSSYTAADEETYVAKIADYGLSMHIKQDVNKYGYAGTFPYMAPELIFSQPHGRAVDIWAFGCMALEIVLGHVVFTDCENDNKRIISKMIELLGSPIVPLKNDAGFEDVKDHVPCFGYWEKARALFNERGLQTKTRVNYTIDQDRERFMCTIQNENTKLELEGYFEVIRKCLMWDPRKRATAEQLLEMPFFAKV
ncbi:hypothetical protein WICPIJ_005438 [Wickerhamomyces pijperi]|uniref:Protein kinase domain-containing protein n=1 Tax=Wickerhamomyces pijperi TaxID=599730 RepID=A0A9P8Q3W1_WICPI|nr:hypothetical protein WICPIJ_005438 [Wickerhamomyces pijperi]